jgi:nucleoid-associated protein YgaU
MRALPVILCFACAFAGAALWQSRRTRALREQREMAARIQSGELAVNASGVIEAGWAKVVVGRPAGEPADSAGTSAPPQAEPIAPMPATPASTPVLTSDFEITVEPGQSLSEIARAHYGTAARDLVAALARYNALADADSLRAGARLRLPAMDRLTARSP